MKLQTTKTQKKIRLINILLMIMLVIGGIFCYLDFQFLENYDIMFVLASIILLIYLSYLGAPYFKYDSEGETLIMQNEKAMPYSLVRDTKSDFPKRKLIDFRIENKILGKKRLDIYIVSKRVNSGKTKISFDISYLNKRKVQNLSRSLNKMILDNTKKVVEI